MNRELLLVNGLSLSRLLLLWPVCYGVLEGRWAVVALVFIAAVVTDLADGYLARRFNCATPLGGVLDHASDAVFISAALFALACREMVSMLLPVLVILSFIQYVMDSRALSGERLRSSALGRCNGIGYFVLFGFAVVSQLSVNVVDLRAVVPVLAWLLIATTLVSMADRMRALLAKRA